MAEHNDTGKIGERLVYEILADVGSVGAGRLADLRFEGVEIEVKTARPSQYRPGRRGYQFSLRRDGHSDVKAPIVVLVALYRDAAVFFVIPASVIGCRRKLAITNPNPLRYRGRWSAYRGRWELLAETV